MRWLNDHLVMPMTILFFAATVSALTASLIIGHNEPSTAFLATMAAVWIGMVLTARCAVRLDGPRELTVDKRAHEHRESMSGMPAPQHPDTAGRPRSRAPSQLPRVA